MSVLSSFLKKAMAKLALVVMLTGIVAPMHAVANGNSGQITIRVTPSEGAYQVLDDVTGAVALSLRSGSVSVAGFPAGDYKITYEDIAGYTKPADEHFSMIPGGQVTLIGDYQRVTNSGTLNVVVTPAAGTYEVRDNVTGAIIASERSGSQSFVIPFGDYIVDFKDIAGGYATPADQSFNLDANHMTVSVTGIYETVSISGTVSVTVSPAIGKYEIKDNVTGAVIAAETVGSKSFVIPFGDYIVDFKDIAGGYATPADQPFNLDANNSSVTINGDYGSITASGALNVTVSPAAGTYEVRDNVTGAVAVSQTSGNGSFVLPYGDYIVDFKDIEGGYITPADQTFDMSAQTKPVSIVGNYASQTQISPNSIVIRVHDQSNAPISNGQWSLKSCTGTTLATCTTDYKNGSAGATLNDVPAGTFGIFAILTSGYTGVAVLSANPQTLSTGSAIVFDIQYSTATSNTGAIQINVKDDAGTAVTGADWTLAGGSAPVKGTATQTLSSVALGDYTVIATVPAALASTYSGVTVTPATAQTLAKGQTLTFEVVYQRISSSNTGAIQINVKDDAGVAVTNGSWVLTKNETQTYTPTPVTGTGTQTLSLVVPGNYTLTATVPAALASTYSGVTVTPAGAQDLAKGQTLTFEVVYKKATPIFSLTKTASGALLTDGSNNQRVSYTITLTRLQSDNLPITVTLHDTMTGTRSISAVGGGVLNYVPGTYSCLSCSSPTNDGLADANVTVALTAVGSSATITYQMLSANAGQTASAQFTNTVTATAPGITIAPASASITVNPPAIIPPTTTGSSSGYGSVGGGGISGGGYTLIKGDLKLNITKQISLDGSNYLNLGNKNALAIPENKATRLFSKITLNNPSDLSVRNLRLAPLFDSGKSDMTGEKIQDLKGATMDKQGNIVIEKIKSKETVSFTYSVMVHENGRNANPAFEGLQVTAIDTFLPDVQDGLTYKNLGERIVTALYAGQIPATAKAVEESKPAIPTTNSANGSDELSIQVSTDKAQAAIGDTVNFRITLKNLSDSDLTNLFITHAYPAELDLVNTGGGRDDGRELNWKSAMLRPGESMTLRFVAKVVAGTPGSRLHSTTRALANEIENISPVDSFLTVIGGAPSPVAKTVRLAQTGPGGILLTLMFLSALSAFAFVALGKRRTMKNREMALRPL